MLQGRFHATVREPTTAMKHSFPSLDDALGTTFKRQPYYCEENAWHLCQEPHFGDRIRHVVFISNLERAVPMWNQKAGRGKAIVWDYHVVVLAEDPLEIWDVDTLLGLPIGLGDYIEASFHPDMPAPYQPMFRLVEAQLLVEIFASDRSHMRRKDGSYRKPPPNWPMIGKPGVSTNLMQFVDMSQPFIGEVCTLNELLDALDDPSRGAPEPQLATGGLRILADIGFALVLDRCVRCGRPCPLDAPACLDPLFGGLVCRACGGARLVVKSDLRTRIDSAAAGDDRALRIEDARIVIDLVDAVIAAHAAPIR